MKISLLLSLLIFNNLEAYANFSLLGINWGEYRIGLYKNDVPTINYQKITHLILVGSARKQDSDQFFQSGISRAERYKEIWPDHQVVFMSSPEVKNTSDERVFDKYKIQVVKTIYKKFTANLMLNEIAAFKKIASLDFYGHSSPWEMIIGKSNASFDPQAYFSFLKNLRPQFIPNSYITLNGCNTGFYIAPELSRALAIPVSGSLTSSMFERIESDGLWYKEEDWTRNGAVQFNKFSYQRDGQCSLGLCTRMKSSRNNYSSHWGTFTNGGLSFDKFFCNYENNKDGRCERGMAMSLFTFPSVFPIDFNSDENDFKKVIYDWLCSTGNNKKYFKNCINGIEKALSNGNLIYRSHSSNELNCDFNSCHAEVICQYKTLGKGPVPGSCNLKTITNPNPKNVAKEFLNLMKGFEDLKYSY